MRKKVVKRLKSDTRGGRREIGTQLERREVHRKLLVCGRSETVGVCEFDW